VINIDFRERLMTTFNHEEPDRVPIMGLIIDPTTSNLILDKKPQDLAKLLKKPVLKGIVKAAMNRSSVWYNFFLKQIRDCLDSSIKLGFDANWAIYTKMMVQKDPSTKLGMVFHDLNGRVWDIGTDKLGNPLIGYTRGLLKTEEEWDDWINQKEPLFEKFLKNMENFYKTIVDEYSSKIYPICYPGSGPFENSWQPMGFSTFAKYTIKKPKFIKKVIDFYGDFYIKCFDAICKSDVEIVLGGDDLGFKTGPLMNPERYDKLFGETYTRLADFLHAKGKKLVWHTCGQIYEFLPYFVKWGFDGIITMEPTAGMDVGKVREKVGHDLVLIGNLDVSQLLVNGSKEEIQNEVKSCIRKAAKGGGYVLSACHSHPDVDPERLKWMVEAGREFGEYPIKI